MMTQKGLAMVGDFRTDALHGALNDAAIPLETAAEAGGNARCIIAGGDTWVMAVLA